MGKFVARTFIPGETANEDEAYAFDTAWEAWESLLTDREKVEHATHGPEWVPPLYGVVGELIELAEPNAYGDDNTFGVATIGESWLGSKGTGTIWGRVPGMDHENVHDKGICYQVSYETAYNGL